MKKIKTDKRADERTPVIVGTIQVDAKQINLKACGPAGEKNVMRTKTYTCDVSQCELTRMAAGLAAMAMGLVYYAVGSDNAFSLAFGYAEEIGERMLDVELAGNQRLFVARPKVRQVVPAVPAAGEAVAQ